MIPLYSPVIETKYNHFVFFNRTIFQILMINISICLQKDVVSIGYSKYNGIIWHGETYLLGEVEINFFFQKYKLIKKSLRYFDSWTFQTFV